MTSAANKFARPRMLPMAALAKDILSARVNPTIGFTITSTTLADITSLSLALRAGTSYALEAWILSQQTGGNGALGVSFAYSAAALVLQQSAILSAPGFSTSQFSGGNQGGAIAESSARSPGFAGTLMFGTITTTNAGNLTVQAQISAGNNIVYGAWVRAIEL